MRFERTDGFKADYRRLNPEEQALFRDAVRDFATACDAEPRASGRPPWPKKLRVKPLQGAPGVWEMSWSFSGPDGRATWEWTTVTTENATFPAVRWRRIGSHANFSDP